ncbi:MAG: hypothetical protein ACOH19_15195 [Rhodoglobus sp.]
MKNVFFACLAIVGTAVLLSACATEPKPSEATGPWAAEFKSNYDRAESDFVREVLIDGKITDQEFSETFELFRSCLAKVNIVITDQKEDGSFSTESSPGTSTDDSFAATSKCSHESGEDLIGSLYSFVQRNPQRLDEATIMAQCLLGKGAVPPNYTAEEFADDATSGEFPLILEDGEKVLQECSIDPLGIHGK